METTTADRPDGNLASRALDAGRKAASGVADAMNTATRRVRERDYRAVLEDARRFVDEKPGAALLAAAVIGFVLARLLARR
jgi:ElaB/YqjD/DUF883 family membrane-anchored ribosome-binding protein